MSAETASKEEAASLSVRAIRTAADVVGIGEKKTLDALRYRSNPDILLYAKDLPLKNVTQAVEGSSPKVISLDTPGDKYLRTMIELQVDPSLGGTMTSMVAKATDGKGDTTNSEYLYGTFASSDNDSVHFFGKIHSINEDGVFWSPYFTVPSSKSRRRPNPVLQDPDIKIWARPTKFSARTVVNIPHFIEDLSTPGYNPMVSNASIYDSMGLAGVRTTKRLNEFKEAMKRALPKDEIYKIREEMRKYVAEDDSKLDIDFSFRVKDATEFSFEIARVLDMISQNRITEISGLKIAGLSFTDDPIFDQLPENMQRLLRSDSLVAVGYQVGQSSPISMIINDGEEEGMRKGIAENGYGNLRSDDPKDYAFVNTAVPFIGRPVRYIQKEESFGRTIVSRPLVFTAPSVYTLGDLTPAYLRNEYVNLPNVGHRFNFTFDPKMFSNEYVQSAIAKIFKREGDREDEQRTQGFNQLIDMIHDGDWKAKALSGNKQKVSIEFPAVGYVAYNEFSMLGDEISLYDNYGNDASFGNKNKKTGNPLFRLLGDKGSVDGDETRQRSALIAGMNITDPTRTEDYGVIQQSIYGSMCMRETITRILTDLTPNVRGDPPGYEISVSLVNVPDDRPEEVIIEKMNENSMDNIVVSFFQATKADRKNPTFDDGEFIIDIAGQARVFAITNLRMVYNVNLSKMAIAVRESPIRLDKVVSNLSNVNDLLSGLCALEHDATFTRLNDLSIRGRTDDKVRSKEETVIVKWNDDAEIISGDITHMTAADGVDFIKSLIADTHAIIGLYALPKESLTAIQNRYVGTSLDGAKKGKIADIRRIIRDFGDRNLVLDSRQDFQREKLSDGRKRHASTFVYGYQYRSQYQSPMTRLSKGIGRTTVKNKIVNGDIRTDPVLGDTPLSIAMYEALDPLVAEVKEEGVETGEEGVETGEEAEERQRREVEEAKKAEERQRREAERQRKKREEAETKWSEAQSAFRAMNLAKKELEEAQNLVASTRGELQEVIQLLSTTREETDAVILALDPANKEYSDKKGEVDKATRELNRAQKGKETGEMDITDEEIQSMENNVKKLKKEEESLREKAQGLADRNEELKPILRSAMEKKKTLDSALAEDKQKVAQLTEAVNTAEEKFNALDKEAKDLYGKANLQWKDITEDPAPDWEEEGPSEPSRAQKEAEERQRREAEERQKKEDAMAARSEAEEALRAMIQAQKQLEENRERVEDIKKKIDAMERDIETLNNEETLSYNAKEEAKRELEEKKQEIIKADQAVRQATNDGEEEDTITDLNEKKESLEIEENLLIDKASRLIDEWKEKKSNVKMEKRVLGENQKELAELEGQAQDLNNVAKTAEENFNALNEKAKKLYEEAGMDWTDITEDPASEGEEEGEVDPPDPSRAQKEEEENVKRLLVIAKNLAKQLELARNNRLRLSRDDHYARLYNDLAKISLQNVKTTIEDFEIVVEDAKQEKDTAKRSLDQAIAALSRITDSVTIDKDQLNEAKGRLNETGTAENRRVVLKDTYDLIQSENAQKVAQLEKKESQLEFERHDAILQTASDILEQIRSDVNNYSDKAKKAEGQATRASEALDAAKKTTSDAEQAFNNAMENALEAANNSGQRELVEMVENAKKEISVRKENWDKAKSQAIDEDDEFADKAGRTNALNIAYYNVRTIRILADAWTRNLTAANETKNRLKAAILKSNNDAKEYARRYTSERERLGIDDLQTNLEGAEKAVDEEDEALVVAKQRVENAAESNDEEAITEANEQRDVVEKALDNAKKARDKILLEYLKAEEQLLPITTDRDLAEAYTDFYDRIIRELQTEVERLENEVKFETERIELKQEEAKQAAERAGVDYDPSATEAPIPPGPPRPPGAPGAPRPPVEPTELGAWGGVDLFMYRNQFISRGMVSTVVRIRGKKGMAAIQYGGPFIRDMAEMNRRMRFTSGGIGKGSYPAFMTVEFYTFDEFQKVVSDDAEERDEAQPSAFFEVAAPYVGRILDVGGTYHRVNDSLAVVGATFNIKTGRVVHSTAKTKAFRGVKSASGLNAIPQNGVVRIAGGYYNRARAIVTVDACMDYWFIPTTNGRRGEMEDRIFSLQLPDSKRKLRQVALLHIRAQLSTRDTVCRVQSMVFGLNKSRALANTLGDESSVSIANTLETNGIPRLDMVAKIPPIIPTRTVTTPKEEGPSGSGPGEGPEPGAEIPELIIPKNQWANPDQVNKLIDAAYFLSKNIEELLDILPKNYNEDKRKEIRADYDRLRGYIYGESDNVISKGLVPLTTSEPGDRKSFFDLAEAYVNMFGGNKEAAYAAIPAEDAGSPDTRSEEQKRAFQAGMQEFNRIQGRLRFIYRKIKEEKNKYIETIDFLKKENPVIRGGEDEALRFNDIILSQFRKYEGVYHEKLDTFLLFRLLVENSGYWTAKEFETVGNIEADGVQPLSAGAPQWENISDLDFDRVDFSVDFSNKFTAYNVKTGYNAVPYIYAPHNLKAPMRSGNDPSSGPGQEFSTFVSLGEYIIYKVVPKVGATYVNDLMLESIGADRMKAEVAAKIIIQNMTEDQKFPENDKGEYMIELFGERVGLRKDTKEIFFHDFSDSGILYEGYNGRFFAKGEYVFDRARDIQTRVTEGAAAGRTAEGTAGGKERVKGKIKRENIKNYYGLEDEEEDWDTL